MKFDFTFVDNFEIILSGVNVTGGKGRMIKCTISVLSDIHLFLPVLTSIYI